MIHRKSEGHPLFATGAIQLLAERGDIVRTNGAWKLKQPLAQIELDAPVSVRSMIEKKVGLLSDEQRQTLLYASIEGEVFTSTVLAALLEADELELEERLDMLGKATSPDPARKARRICRMAPSPRSTASPTRCIRTFSTTSC